MKKSFRFVLVVSIVLNVVLAGYLVAKHYSYIVAPVRIPMAGKFTIQQKLSINDSDIVFVGNSLTEYFPVTEMFNNIHVKNRGVAQSITPELVTRMSIIIKGKPKKIFLMDGINDITGGIHERATFSNIEQIISDIKNESPTTKIYIESILPVSYIPNNAIIKRYNSRLKEYCVEQKITYINLFDAFYDGKRIKSELTYDGTHLTGDGYLLWKRNIQNYVN